MDYTTAGASIWMDTVGEEVFPTTISSLRELHFRTGWALAHSLIQRLLMNPFPHTGQVF
jgi:hypothetical protein